MSFFLKRDTYSVTPLTTRIAKGLYWMYRFVFLVGLSHVPEERLLYQGSVYVSKMIIEQHHSQVGVQSMPGSDPIF